MAVELHTAPPGSRQPATHVVIGGGERRELRRHLGRLFGDRPCFVAGDADVLGLWLDDIDVDVGDGYLSVPAGEAAKTPEVLAHVCSTLTAAGLTRDGYVVAIGGGATGDLVGLAAALHLRGVPVVQVPTTLLAMVDAGLGGKCAVNLPQGKNLLGTFWAPSLMVVDPDFLETLPELEFRSGVGEVAKYAIGFSVELLERLESCGGLTDANLADVIATCVRIKAEIVGEDPYETAGGRRVLLNLGHTSAHALESWGAAHGHSVPHGLAVGWGLRVACKLATADGRMSSEDLARAEALLDTLGLPHDAGDLVPEPPPPAELAPFVGRDKKRTSSTLRCVLPCGPGRCEAVAIDEGRFISAMG